MTDRICQNGHVIDGSEKARSGADVCSRCGTPEAVDTTIAESSQEKTTMTDETNDQVAPAADTSSENSENPSTESAESQPENTGSDEAKTESTDEAISAYSTESN